MYPVNEYDKEYSTMATNESTFGTATKTAANIIGMLVGIAALGAIIMIGLPYINTKALQQIIILPTSDTSGLKARATPIPAFDTRVDAAPALSLDQVNATSIAIYQATVVAVDSQSPAQNVDQLPADASMPQYVEKPAPDRQPAGANNVSVAVPIDAAHGSKETGPVNIQETHECKRAQVWTAGGCKNPTPVK